MWDNIKFWLTKSIAELMTALAILAGVLVIAGAVMGVVWCFGKLARWRSRRS